MRSPKSGGVDFDDLVVRALGLLQTDERVLDRWRGRCRNLLVDEAQDLDRTQLELALLLAAPANNVFLVGDDDQTIYGWRLADVRRVLGLAVALPGLRRVDLETNYRCPRPVVERAVRLVEHNRERFAKRIVRRPGGGRPPGPRAGHRQTTSCGSAAPCARWPVDDSTRAVLARTNRELLAAVVAAVELRVPFRAPDLPLPIEDERLDALLERALADGPDTAPLLTLGRLRADLRAEALAAQDVDTPPELADGPTPADLVTAMLGWAASLPTLADLRSAIDERRRQLAELRRDDARLSLATAHGTKGLEWDHVVVLADGFPGRRSIADATEPERALEEERRLAYVAWTRARRSLTLLFDPQAPSPFLLEAFSPDELGLGTGTAAA